MSCSIDPSRFPLDRFEELDSTSVHARALLQDADAPARPRVIQARRQTAGRGRFGRAWASPEGGLWCTLIWPLGPGASVDADEVLQGLGLRIGLACARTIEHAIETCGVRREVRLKWPNDVLINGKKVLGVLVEVVAERGGRWALVGVGINANFDRASLPLELITKATTLRHETGRDHPLDDIREQLMARLTDALQARALDGATVQAARDRLHGVGLPLEEAPTGGAPAVLLGLSDAGLPIYGPPTGVES